MSGARPAATAADTGRPQPTAPRAGQRLAGAPLDAVLVGAVTVAYLLPMFAASFVVPKGFRPITEDVPSVGRTVELLGTACSGALLLVCLAVLVLRRGDVRRVLGPVLLLVLGWALGVAGLVAHDADVPQRLVLVPLVCVAFAVARPGMAAVRAFGAATVALAGVSLVLAVMRPSAVRYQVEESQLDDKFVWAYGILSGPFGSGNNLGLALAAGLPAVLFLGRRWVRGTGLVLVAFALAWTFSRTSWVAAAAALGVGAVLVVLPRLRRPVAAAALGGLGVVVVGLPLVTSSATAFSNRGGFWQQALDVWRDRPWTGWGTDYYMRLAQSDDNLGGFAFHAHNQAVHLLVTGGLLLLVVVGAAYVWAGVVAVRLAVAGNPWPTMTLAALLVSATFEVPLGLADRTMFFSSVLVPLCVLLTWAAVHRPAPR